MLSSLYAGHPGSIMLERLCRPISVTVQHLGGQRVPSLLGYAQCCSFSSSRTFSISHLFMLVLCTKFLCYPTSKTYFLFTLHLLERSAIPMPTKQSGYQTGGHRHEDPSLNSVINGNCHSSDSHSFHRGVKIQYSRLQRFIRAW